MFIKVNNGEIMNDIHGFLYNFQYLKVIILLYFLYFVYIDTLILFT